MRTLLVLGGLVAGAAALPAQSAQPDWVGPKGSSKPFLTRTPSGDLLVTWFEPRAAKRYALMIAHRGRTGWSSPRLVAESDRFFVNWADFPSVAHSSKSAWVVHWLEKTATKAYAYHVRISSSTDQGRTWSAPVTAHTDTTPTEHGFVAMVPASDGSVDVAWLDGRAMANEGGAMSVRTASWRPNGTMSGETVLDTRSCECCQVSMTRATAGLVTAYRDRSLEEVRDIVVVRERGGTWSEPTPVARDNWVWKACPVNGPSVSAHGSHVGVAWYTGAGGSPRVKFSLSTDGGESFRPAVQVDEGNPLGRVHLQMVGPTDALVTWLEMDGDDPKWLLRRIGPRGAGTPLLVGPSSRARDGGFPRTTLVGSDLYVAWTDPGRGPDDVKVRVRRIPLNKVK
ncbi:MAG: sialidase family protein [Gemmatimonadales bacterium]